MQQDKYDRLHSHIHYLTQSIINFMFSARLLLYAGNCKGRKTPHTKSKTKFCMGTILSYILRKILSL